MALLKQYKTDYGTIRIMRSKQDGSMAYYQEGSFHSQASRNGTSVCAYVHVIHEMIRQRRARNILIIGCAGGTLATMLRRLNCKVTAVDINPMAFVIARRHFRLPDDVRCIRKDGIAYLRTTKKIYDAVVIDVFGADNSVPRSFTTEGFFHLVKNVLSPGGTAIMNVMTRDDEDKQADSIARRLRSSGMDVSVYDWPNQKNRNTLIVGGAMQTMQIPSGKEPHWIHDDLDGLMNYQPKKYAFA